MGVISDMAGDGWIWVCVRSTDGTEWGLSTPEGMVQNPCLQQDVDGGPMVLMRMFRAPSYEEAKRVHEDIMAGWRQGQDGGDPGPAGVPDGGGRPSDGEEQ